MTWFLTGLAEAWRWRWRIGLPVLLGIAWGALQVIVYPHVFEAQVFLQLQSEQAREPLLQKITADGHRTALLQKLRSSDVLADSSREVGVEIRPEQLNLMILNDHMMGIAFRSTQRDKIEQVVDSVAFNFIQQVLAPERSRIERLLNDSKTELVEVIKEIDAVKAGNVPGASGAVLGGIPGGTRGSTGSPEAGLEGAKGATMADDAARDRMAALEQLALKRSQLEQEVLRLQTDLRLVNTAFDRDGAQALLWFAKPAEMLPPAPFWVRLFWWMFWGGFVGFAAGYTVFRMPASWRAAVASARDIHNACGLPLVGVLPWLGALRLNHSGLHVSVQGRTLRPASFSEIGRLQTALTRALRGPLVVLGVNGQEGVSTLALLLAEKSASLGKKTILVDFNLKNHGLTGALGLRGEAWSMPSKRKKDEDTGTWSALQPLTGMERLRVLPAPRNPETLRILAERDGLAALMDHLKTLADVVIVDASPVTATNRGNLDAVTVAGVADRVALVSQTGMTNPADLRMATDALLLAGTNLVGVVLNQQFAPTRRQLLAEVADFAGRLMPPLGRALRKASVKVRD